MTIMRLLFVFLYKIYYKYHTIIVDQRHLMQGQSTV